MIFYGWKEKAISTEASSHTCVKCKAGKLVGVVFQRYFHVYWLPMFPLGKRVVSVCSSCQAVTDISASPRDVTMTLDGLKKAARLPIWTFSGLAIVALLVGAGTIHSRNKDERVKTSLLAPQVGDVLLVKTKAVDKYDHILMKIVNVDDHDIALLPGRYQFNFFGGDKQLREQTYSRESDYFVHQPLHVDSLKALEVVDLQRSAEILHHN